MQFIGNKDLGYDPSGVLSISSFATEDREAGIKQQVGQLSGVEAVCLSSWIPTRGDASMTKQIIKQQSGKDILVGSRSLIIQLLNNNLIDEFQICIHPIIEGKGLPLFDQIKDRIVFKLIKTKSLNSGATVFYYQPT